MSNKPDESEFFFRKSPQKTYISKSIQSEIASSEQMRFISRVLDGESQHEFVIQKGEIVLRATGQKRVEIKALFYENTRTIRYLTIQRFERRTGKPHKETSITLSQEALLQLIQFLRVIPALSLEHEGKQQLSNDYLEALLLDESEKIAFFKKNSDLVAQFVQNGIAERDIIALGYRKKQLEIFERLLRDSSFFNECRYEWNIQSAGDEAVWQRFFEDNTWIFGYGLNYIFNSSLASKKLEQVTSGATFYQSGKRVDAILKTKGLISSLCFAEIKTHRTDLLQKKQYRPDSWSVSTELTGAVSQIQKTVQKAILDIRTRVELKSETGEPTGETAFLYQPKAYVIIGCLDEFLNEHGAVNESKFSSFELFRRNLNNPEIITFDELYERAKFIVFHNQKQEEANVSDTTEEYSFDSNRQYDTTDGVDDIPF